MQTAVYKAFGEALGCLHVCTSCSDCVRVSTGALWRILHLALQPWPAFARKYANREQPQLPRCEALSK